MDKIPQKVIPKQNNYGDIFDDFVASYNLDLTSGLGKIRISPRILLNGNTTDYSTLGIPHAFKSFQTTGTLAQWWTIGGTSGGTPGSNGNLHYSTGGLDGTVTKMTPSPDPSGQMDPDYTDLEVFNDELYMTETGTTVNYVKNDFTTASIASAQLTGAGFHGMTAFHYQQGLYLVDDSSRSISYIDNAHNATNAAAGSNKTIYRIVDGNQIVISWIRSTTTRIWFGTLNFNGKSAKVYAWDGARNSNNGGPQEVYTLDSAGSYACVIKDDVPWIIDAEGRLLAFNGGTFVEKDRLPLDIASGKYLPFTGKGTNRLVHYNGMDLVEGKINILINTAPYDTNWPSSTSIEKMPSGVWEYTEETGLYHKASVGNTKSGGTINDYGQQKIKYVGALASLKLSRSGITAGSVAGSYIVGAEYYTNASSTSDGIWYDDFANTLQKAGYFVTKKFLSSNITDTWQQIYLRFRRFLNSTDKIVVKYRTSEDEPTEATITYVDTTSFTVPASSFTTNPAVGNEVEILQGVGAGRTMHITAVTGTTTLTITVDETITGATTQTAKARFQTWKKIGTHDYNSELKDFLKFPITEGNTATWVQFKFWILFTGKNEIYDGTISNEVNEAIE